MNSNAEALDYRHLESAILDAARMADIACEMVDSAGHRASRQEEGWILSEEEMGRLAWSVVHTNKLIRELENQWDKIHASNVEDRS